ncbi:MAG TPA: transposase [Bryobacteraceae bacterium]|nr:transposase [Bryobacteraceae bacterium]
MRKRQKTLFADGSEVKYFAVASNEWEWEAKQLLEWHREKAGSVEARHDVRKNELGAGVMPCGRCGANAAWLRLAVMPHNVRTALKRIALPEPWLRARPKRLRFQIFCSPGKLVHHARQVLLRVSRVRDRLCEWLQALRLLPLPAGAPVCSF